MELIKKNAKPIAIIAGSATIALSFYLLFKKFSKKATSNLGFAARPVRKLLTENEKVEIIKQVKVTYNGQMLSPDSLAFITEAQRKFYAAECFNLVTENYKLRRRNKDNFAAYVRICEEFLEKLGSLTVVALTEVLDRLGIPQNDYVSSFEYYFNQGDPTVLGIEGDITDRQAKESQPRKTLTKDEFKAVLIRNIELLETERFNVFNVQRMLKNPVNTGTVLYYKINDIIFEELGIEDQEFAVAMGIYANHADIQNSGLIEKYMKAAGDLGAFATSEEQR